MILLYYPDSILENSLCSSNHHFGFCSLSSIFAPQSFDFYAQPRKVNKTSKSFLNGSERFYVVTDPTGRPRAIYGQRYPLPCFAWLCIWVRGSRTAVPKGAKSCRTQRDFRLSVCLFVWAKKGLIGLMLGLRKPSRGLERLIWGLRELFKARKAMEDCFLAWER